MKVKLKIILAATMVATGCIAGISRYHTNESNAITLANVEALADTVITIEYDKCCLADSELDCIPNYMGLINGMPVKC